MCASICLPLSGNGSAPFHSCLLLVDHLSISLVSPIDKEFFVHVQLLLCLCLYVNSFFFNIFMINNMTTHFQLLLGLFKLFSFWSLSPQSEETFFDGGWAWTRTNDMVSGQVLQGLNSIVILEAWMLSNNRNMCVLDGGSPYLHCALLLPLRR